MSRSTLRVVRGRRSPLLDRCNRRPGRTGLRSRRPPLGSRTHESRDVLLGVWTSSCRATVRVASLNAAWVTSWYEGRAPVNPEVDDGRIRGWLQDGSIRLGRAWDLGTYRWMPFAGLSFPLTDYPVSGHAAPGSGYVEPRAGLRIDHLLRLVLRVRTRQARIVLRRRRDQRSRTQPLSDPDRRQRGPFPVAAPDRRRGRRGVRRPRWSRMGEPRRSEHSRHRWWARPRQPAELGARGVGRASSWRGNRRAAGDSTPASTISCGARMSKISGWAVAGVNTGFRWWGSAPEDSRAVEVHGFGENPCSWRISFIPLTWTRERWPLSAKTEAGPRAVRSAAVCPGRRSPSHLVSAQLCAGGPLRQSVRGRPAIHAPGAQSPGRPLMNALAGWWGIPWGLGTPVVVIKQNLWQLLPRIGRCTPARARETRSERDGRVERSEPYPRDVGGACEVHPCASPPQSGITSMRSAHTPRNERPARPPRRAFRSGAGRASARHAMQGRTRTGNGETGRARPRAANVSRALRVCRPAQANAARALRARG